MNNQECNKIDHWQCLGCSATFDKEVSVCPKCGGKFIQPVLVADMEEK